jgi:hypothetical protein
MKRVPLLTGILAALAGYLTVRMANLSNEAIYLSNQGVLMQALASDAWAEYQADSIKAHIVQTTLDAGIADPAARAKLEKDMQEFNARKPALKATADDLVQKREAQLGGGKGRLAQRDLLNYASMLIQLGIALASVAALTKRFPAFAVAAGAGLVGIIMTACAVIPAYLGKG